MKDKVFNIVINPNGASGTAQTIFKKIEPLLIKNNIKYIVHTSSISEGISSICSRLTKLNEDIYLVLIGGDGSLNEAVNGIVNFEKTYVGFIPCGSGNDFARSINLPQKLDELVSIIFKGEVKRTCDIGEVTMHNFSEEFRKLPDVKDNQFKRKFNVSTGIGFDAEICQKTQVTQVKPFLNKIRLGKLSYLFEAIRVIFSTKMLPVKITLDDNEEEYSKCLLSVCMNQPYEGGGFKFCPEADDEDGLLDICIGDHLRRIDFFRIFPYAYTGEHVKFKGVYTKKFRHAEIQTPIPLWVHTDGEVYCKSSHISIELTNEKLNLLQ